MGNHRFVVSDHWRNNARWDRQYRHRCKPQAGDATQTGTKPYTGKYFEPLRLSDLAAAAEMTPKYFCRAFAGMTGRTPVDYLIYYRVERACESLS